MKAVRTIYNYLKRNEYFEDNINLMFATPNKSQQRLVESLLISKDDYKNFVKQYCRLRDALQSKEDSTLLRQTMVLMLEQMYTVEHNQFVHSNCITYFGLLFLDLLKTTTNTYNTGFYEIQTKELKVLDILFDQALSEQQTKAKLIQYFNLPKNNHVLEPITVDWFMIYMNSHAYALIYPELFNTGFITRAEEYMKEFFLKMITDVTDFAEHNIGVHVPVAIYSELISASFSETKIQLNNFNPLKRSGYLKEDKCHLDFTGIFDDMRVRCLLDIKEIIRPQGIIVAYQIKTEESIILAFEDYTKDNLVLIQTFIDRMSEINNPKIIDQLSYIYYSIVRHKYAELIQEKNSVQQHTEVTLQKPTVSGEVMYKAIQIAPYARKVPSGKIPSPKLVKQAKLFNIDLKPGETLVHSFIRNQPYKIK